MNQTFKLTVMPGLLSEGEFAGHLETVHFIAKSETELHEWWAVNTGTLEQEFGQVVSLELASHLVGRLRVGETVEFPNRYAFEEVKCKIGGRWQD
ncbi:hypothetical protein HDF16_005211 [Granulicella aggregans]|uniref:Uncharacterized protein n=1 Tax=Granulicella aggregans TaxID=474949 RepID=A0A7W7ZID0_9BACT|nr:hypothetical protein [Granulicella aggregans]MBB5060475.1 hypothetical protein [Granulicella aggregans]